MARIVCVGSLNHDITVWVPRRPEPDETLHGDRVEEFRGGKGANQIVAAARLGAETSMVGCVGVDGRGDFLLRGLDIDGVDRGHVRRVDIPTGVALITVDPDDVSIVVVSGANSALDPSMVVEARDVIEGADALLLQGEVPAAAAAQAAQIASAMGTLVVFNPAPFNDVAEAVIPLADVLIVNRLEAAELGAVNCRVLVTTLGQFGCDITVDGATEHVPPFDANTVDPTGAGDCFAAAMAVGLAEGMSPVDAASFANAAGSIAVEKAGAQPSLPTRGAVDERLATH
ncbi:MAG: ribokinase [Actinobacteria bacterium]|nr:ribokinase [Actinomycetota bacterium]